MAVNSLPPRHSTSAGRVQGRNAMSVERTLAALILGGKDLIESIGGISTALQWPNQVKYWCIPVACSISMVTLIASDIPERGWRSALAPALAIGLAGLAYVLIDARLEPLLA